ncbi:MAG: HU family DNA-binding protein [Acidimicrobiales bacterium]
MNRRELIRAVAAHTADDVRHVESVLSGVTDVITAVVAKGEPVTIQGFAKFAKVERAARMGRNPRTGEAIRIKASKRVRVTPMKTFKDTVMAPSHAPRLARGVYPTSPDLLTAQAAERRAAASGTTSATAKKAPARKAAASTPTKTTAKKAATRATTVKATRKTAAASTPTKTTAKKAATRATTVKATRKTAAASTAAKATAKKAAATRAPRR